MLKGSHKVGLVLIFCYLVAWLDRMAINMTIPFIAKDLNIGPDKMGWILSAFFLGYALFQIPGGLLADKFGPRKVIMVALSWWSVFTALTGMTSSLINMLTIRLLFGIGEGIFPASVWKVLGSWFTKKNRTTANALVISAIAMGPALTPLILAPLIARYGWRFCFYFLGILGIICVLLAKRYIYNTIHEGPSVSQSEKDEFEIDLKSQEANIEKSLEHTTFKNLIKEPMLWAFSIFGLFYNVGMYGWLTWLPTYLIKVKNLDLTSMAFAASIPFIFATIGCMSAGFISDKYFRGKRKILIVVCSFTGSLCLFLFTNIDNVTAYMIMQCIAGFTLFMAASAFWALPLTILPTKLMGAGSGFINTGGQIGGFVTNIIIGYVITWTGNYASGFIVMIGSIIIATIILILFIKERK